MTQSPDTIRSDGGLVTHAELPVPPHREKWHIMSIPITMMEYRLSVRNRWVIALTAVFATFALGLITFSGAPVGPEGYARIIASLAVLAVYLVPLAALAFGYDSIVGAAESGWLQSLLALPIQRDRIVRSVYLGRALALASAIVIGFGIAGLMLIQGLGMLGWEGFASFLVATVALGIVFLGIAVLISTVCAQKAHALGASLVVWAWFILVHDLLALGLIAAFRLPEAAIATMVITNPAGVYRVLVLGQLGAGGDAGFASVLATAGLSTPLLVGALIAWAVIPIVLAGQLIKRRGFA